ncbi:hypothetical protein CQ018_17655 [Arthrobacter sp. MYb227]|uniref:hypothetical protein n=1 Tax=Arthrobacter sp. MYb227 TaxID=1848601 RepID=UPI000CFD5ECC|nr:hypothetical protein [Arthrobacter sp. MYb227]PQZ87767.1 hypothetical protein CQ018_17655 [Arthrobacter sp. MYb227]
MAELQLPKRRSIIKGAAWSLPVIAAAIAEQPASASAITSGGSYFWKETTSSKATTLSAAKHGLSADYSLQTGLKLSGAPVDFEQNCAIVITVFFNKQVTVSSPYADPGFASEPDLSAPGNIFTFRIKAGSGSLLGFKVTGSKPGVLIATSTMRVENGHPNLSWETIPTMTSAELVR